MAKDDFKPDSIEGDSTKASPRWNLLLAIAVLMLIHALLFQPYALPAAFRPDITGWVFVFSNYPWPAEFMKASTLNFAQMHIWGGQIVAAIACIIVVGALKGKV